MEVCQLPLDKVSAVKAAVLMVRIQEGNNNR